MMGVLLGTYGDVNGSTVSLGLTQAYACTNSLKTAYGKIRSSRENTLNCSAFKSFLMNLNIREK
jgi:hypothetical protein